MTYDPSIPLVTQTPNNSASPTQVNFDQFAKVFSSLAAGVFYNHMPLKNAKQGMHSSVIMQKQTVDPTITEDLTVLYGKDVISNSSTEPQLFVRIPKFLPTQTDTTDAINAPMQLTFNSVGTAGPIYYSFLPGGYLVFFGSTNDVTINITLTPAPTKILIAIANPNNETSIGTPRPFVTSTQIISNDTFKIVSSPTGVYTYTWMAVAKA